MLEDVAVGMAASSSTAGGGGCGGGGKSPWLLEDVAGRSCESSARAVVAAFEFLAGRVIRLQRIYNF